jgi:hypothetical protein
MIRRVVPLFCTMDIPGTLVYYKAKLGFKCLGTWQDPPVYAIVTRDQQAIHFRCADPPTANPNNRSHIRLTPVESAESAGNTHRDYKNHHDRMV